MKYLRKMLICLCPVSSTKECQQEYTNGLRNPYMKNDKKSKGPSKFAEDGYFFLTWTCISRIPNDIDSNCYRILTGPTCLANLSTNQNNGSSNVSSKRRKVVKWL